MSLLLLISLFVLVWYLLRPAIKVLWTMRKMRKGDFSVLNELFGQPGSQKYTSSRRSDGSRRPGWTKARPRKKKIPSDVGEYVKFTEVETSHSETSSVGSDGSTTTTYTREEQVVDAQWEDL